MPLRSLLGALLVTMLGACAYDGAYYERSYYTAATYDDDYYARRYHRAYSPSHRVTRVERVTYPTTYERVAYPTAVAYRDCHECGVVTRIERYRGTRRASGGGAVAGAVVGGLIGNQIGSGSGRRAATVAGAVAGGVAGHNIERNRAGSYYVVHVRMADGRLVVVDQSRLDGVREGAPVIVRNGRAYLR